MGGFEYAAQLERPVCTIFNIGCFLHQAFAVAPSLLIALCRLHHHACELVAVVSVMGQVVLRYVVLRYAEAKGSCRIGGI